MAETDEVCNHLHLPLQSGSDAVLATMRRGYTAERYLSRLAAARAAVPDLAVTTDLIVGFPGETEEHFERTLEVVAEAHYDSAYTFIFSPRPGTRAASMQEHYVPAEVTAERFERLRMVVERSALARHRDRIGRVEEVVVEGPSKRDASLTTGRTSQNKLIHFPPGAGHSLACGTFAEVRVTGAARHHLSGDLVAVTARPSHRTRIPVSAG
jgi:tRNA-2-methylthio-N6-dimethylallyladenosine synthase